MEKWPIQAEVNCDFITLNMLKDNVVEVKAPVSYEVYNLAN